MEKMLVIVFDNQAKAHEGLRALNQLDGEGSIAIYCEAVINKNADGTVALNETDGDFPIRTVSGTAIGSLIGLLGGPAGMALGMLAGTMAGGFADLLLAGIDTDFLDEVSKQLIPSKYAVVAHISEEWVTPIDTRMEALGGFVYRTARKSFQDEQRARDIAEIHAEMDQLKAEHARAHADRKAKLQAKIDGLNARLQKKLQQSQKRSEQLKAESEAKVQVLQTKSAKAQGETKAAIEARVSEIRKQCEQWVEQEKTVVA